jgi:hypothetical protein
LNIKNFELEVDGTDMQADIVSDAVYVSRSFAFSAQLVFTGSPNGTLKVQASLDDGAGENDLSNPTITNWTDVDSQSITSAGSHIFNLSDFGHRWIRIAWTDSSSGSPSTLTVYRANVKGI